MKIFRIIAPIFAAAILYALSPSIASADDWNRATTLTFKQSVEIPGMVLPAGTYVFRRVDTVDPHIVRILSADETHVYATLQTVADYRNEPSEKPVVTFEERSSGSPRAIRSWFYPGAREGEEFLYWPSRAKKDKLAAIESEVSQLRNGEARQAERLDSLEQQSQRNLADARRAMTAAETAEAISSSANRKAADADNRAVTAEQMAAGAMNEVDTVAQQLEGKIANLDRYAMADWTAVTFKFNSDALSKEATNTLNGVVSEVSGMQAGYLIELQGFTDNIGSEKYNLGLSDRRVESVLRYLVNNNIPLYRISLVGLGKTDPIANNSTAEGREQNRRVEVQVLRSSNTVGTASL